MSYEHAHNMNQIARQSADPVTRVKQIELDPNMALMPHEDHRPHSGMDTEAFLRICGGLVLLACLAAAYLYLPQWLAHLLAFALFVFVTVIGHRTRLRERRAAKAKAGKDGRSA